MEEKRSMLGNVMSWLSKLDVLLIILGVVSALAFGLMYQWCVVQLIGGDMINTYNSPDGQREMFNLFLISIYLAVGSFLAGWAMFICWLKLSNKLVKIIRRKYF